MIVTSNRLVRRMPVGMAFVLEGQRARGLGRMTLLAFVLLYSASSLFAGQRGTNLTRSLYVPVRFIVCQHVRNVSISLRGDATVFPLGLRTFLFAYDTEHKQLLPEFVDVRIRGERVNDGEPFITNVIITPGKVTSSVDSGNVDWESLEKQALVRRDIRFPTRQVFITADPDCETEPATAGPAAAASEDRVATKQTSAGPTERASGSPF